jgi:hypothetical protein
VKLKIKFELRLNHNKINLTSAIMDGSPSSRSAAHAPSSNGAHTDFPALPPSFGPEIYGAISEVLGPSDDPLDSPTFSVVEYVNSLFPNGTR